MTNLFYLSLVLSLLLSSCIAHTNSKYENRDTGRKDEVILYLEDSSLHQRLSKKHRFNQDSSTLEEDASLFRQNVTKLIGLQSLTNGWNGRYIRIWNWDFDKKYIIDISNDGVKMSCSVIEFSGKHLDSNDYMVIHRRWKNLAPKSGWNIFFNYLENHNILTLKSGRPYNKQTERLTEMSVIEFEIAQPKSYRFYEYLEPAYYRYVDSGSNKVYDFLKYFEKEMGVSVYNPPEKLFVSPH